MGSGFNFEKVGKFLIAGFGDRVAVGVIFGLIEELTPMQCYNYINENTDLVARVSEDDWVEARKISKDIDLDEITVQRVIDELRKNRLDLLGIILNTPGGVEWVIAQLDKAKDKLGTK